MARKSLRAAAELVNAEVGGAAQSTAHGHIQAVVPAKADVTGWCGRKTFR